MKRILLTLLFLMACTTGALAQGGVPWKIQEVDGSPLVTNPTTIKVSNGTLSCTGKVCTISTGGGGGGAPGGASGTVQWNDGGSFNGTSGLTATATTVTIVSGVSGTFSRAGNLLSLTNTTDSSSVQVALLQGDRATVAGNDEAYQSLLLSNASGTQKEVGRLTWAIPTATAASENGRLDFSVMTGGTLAKELQLAGADLSPSSSDGLALGTASLQWSDLFLASGGVLNFANGNVVLTHSSGILTMGTGELRITTVGTNAASVPTLGSSSILSNKTLATGTAFAGYSDIATIVAPANPSAGSIRLFADSGTGNLTCLTSAGGNCLPSGSSGITIGTTTVTSGTGTRLLYETSGNVVGEISGATSDGTNLTTSSGALRATSPRITTSIFDANGLAIISLNPTASAVNSLQVTNGATGSPGIVDLAAIGSDSNVRLSLTPKGNAGVVITDASANGLVVGPNGTTNPSFVVDTSTASAATGLTVTSKAAGAGIVLSATSSGSNENITLTPKGTGQVILPDGSSSLPSIAFAGATTTGIYNQGAKFDIVVAGTPRLDIGAATSIFSNNVQVGTSNTIGWADLFLRRSAAANLAFGAADAASPVAQTLSVQNVVGGTTNTAGVDWTFKGSAGTGTGAGGKLIFQTAPAGSTGTSQNSFVTALTIDSAGHVIAGGTAPTITSGFGTSPSIAGADQAGRITVGTGGVATTGVVTFGKAFTTAPACTVNNETTILLAQATATTTTLTITSATPFAASDKLTYVCLGY